MKKIQTETKAEDAAKVTAFVTKLNRYRHGKPRSEDFHWKHYKDLLQSVGLPNIRWHDLRSMIILI